LFFLSKRHPYYINLLCSRLIILNKVPSIDDLEKIWQQYSLEERSSIASELDMLSKNQKKLLTILARENGTDQPLGKDFIQKSRMSKATISQSMTFLERHDFVEKSFEGHISIIDPLIKAVLSGGTKY